MSSYFSLEKNMRIKKKLEYMKYNLENPKLIILKNRKVSLISLDWMLKGRDLCCYYLVFSLVVDTQILLMNIAFYIFHKSVCKFEIIYFRECRYEMLFHGTRFIVMLNYCILFKIFSWFLHLEFICYKFIASSVKKQSQT